jgi:hypothetical protein
MTRLQRLCFAFALLVVPAAAFATSAEFKTAYESALMNPNDEQALERLLKLLPTVKHPFLLEKLYVLEGDLGMTRRQIQASLFQANQSVNPLDVRALVNIDSSGEMTYWKTPAERIVRYAVLRGSFPDDDTYEKVATDVAAAAGDWVSACPECKIQFVHRREFDSLPLLADFGPLARTDDLRFVVTYSDQNGSFIAQSFFPGDAWNRRVLLVDPSYFTLQDDTFTGRGVMRHELGHCIGFRHEQIRGVKGCAIEDGHWKPLTTYDPHSVMHYFCGGGGSPKLEISDLDREGLKLLYVKSTSEDK